MNVYIHHNDETGITKFSVCKTDDFEYWLNSFKTKNQAVKYCNDNGHKIIGYHCSLNPEYNPCNVGCKK